MTFETELASGYNAARERLWPSKRTLRPAPGLRHPRAMKYWATPAVIEIVRFRGGWRPRHEDERQIGEMLREAVHRIRFRGISIATIQQEAAAMFDLEAAELLPQRRTKRYAIPRLLAMCLCRNLTPFGTAHIGREFKRDHASVYHAAEKYGEMVAAVTGVPMPRVLSDHFRRHL